MKKIKAMETEIFHRSLSFDERAIDEKTRSVRVAFSSEEPCPRYFGTEILSHDPEAVQLSRLRNAPLLLGHNQDDQIGVIEKAEIGTDRVGRAVVRFGKGAHADEIFQDVLDGIRSNISVGYYINEMELQKKGGEKTPDEYLVTRWTPVEVSVVAVPADSSVGVGRQQSTKIKTIVRDNIMQNSNSDKEKNRIASIQAIAKKAEMLEEGMAAVAAGTSSDDFRALAFDRMLDKMPAINLNELSSGPEIGMSGREINSYSFVKAIRAELTGDWRQAGLEAECSDVVKKQARGKRDYRGVAIPYDVLAHRDLSVGTDSAGGYTVATDLLSGSFIDMLNNAMQVQQLGATVLTGLVGDIAIPKNSTGSTAYWVSEGSDITASAPAFSQVSLSPNTLGCLTDLTRKLILQSSLDIENFIRRHLAERLALAIDLAAINGTGADNQPLGILNTSGIGSVAGGTNGLAPTYANIVELESDIAASNADVGSLGYLTNSKVRGVLKQVFTNATYGEIPLWCDGMLNGYRAEVSNQIPDDLTKGSASGVCSAIIFGNWRDLVIGYWGGLDINVDRSVHSASGGVRIVVMQDVDIACRHAESFSAMLDALTA